MNRRHILGVGVSTGLAAPWASPRPAAAAPVSHRQMHVFARDGTRLAFREFGEGPSTLVFISSWGLDSRMWDYQVAHFAGRGHRCIAFDRRGQGRSDIPAQGYQMDTLADDLAALLEQLNLQGVVLVAHSMGGAEVIRYLAKHGRGRVRKVALIAPAAPFLLRTDDNPYGVPLGVFESVWRQYAQDFPKWAYDNQAAFFKPDTSTALKDAFTRQLLEVPVPVAIATHRALVMTDLRPDLGKIDCPILVLHGDKDASAPLAITGQRVVAGIKNSQLKIYPGAPHGIWITHLSEVNAHLEAFASH